VDWGKNGRNQLPTVCQLPSGTVWRWGAGVAFSGDCALQKLTVETVFRLFSAVVETSADPVFIFASYDFRVILQSLIRRLIPDFCRSTAGSLTLGISILPPILCLFPELPLLLTLLPTSVLGVLKFPAFALGPFTQDHLHSLFLVSGMPPTRLALADLPVLTDMTDQVRR
jgi:hypothetical protein